MALEDRQSGQCRSTVLYLCFFVSGIAGLIYEVLWEKYLALYVGGTGLAQIIVLATFMGGLALGNHFLGGVADRANNPVKLYAALEFGVGIYALWFDKIFFVSRGLFVWLVKLTGLSAWGLVVAKIVASSASILLPAFLMGGTLPAMAKCLIRSRVLIGPGISRLYFLNSFGAVFGCLLAGFFLIRKYGLQFSVITGSLMNIVAGAGALAVLSGIAVTTQARTDGAEEGEPSELADSPRWAAGVVLACAGISGAVSMMYEVAWIRLLTLILGGSTYSFSLMLATFILGLSLGGLVLSMRRKASGYAAVFGVTEILVGASVLLTLPLYACFPYVFNQLACSLARDAATFGLYEFCKFILCAAVMLIPAVLQGITLPAATKVLAGEIGSLGHKVGVVFAVNTVGTLLGVIFAGFVGLPVLGLKGTLEAAVVLNGLIGIAVLASVKGAGLKRPAAMASIGLMAAAWVWYGVNVGNWDRDVLSSGSYRSRQRLVSRSDLVELARNRKTVFYRDGIDATVAVQDKLPSGRERLLVINGKVDATTSGDMPTQKMVAHLPMLCRPDAKDVLIVGVGSGATIAGVLAYGVEHVDVVEISRDVIEASRYFESINGRYWNDQRVSVIWEDAKTYLQVADREYDVIISEPTNPWIAGVAGVFSREYFEACRSRLRPGGLFVQWIQGYELEDSTFFMMLETFSQIFPYYTMWNPTSSDTVLVGAPSPYRPDFLKMKELSMTAPVRTDLSLVGIESLLPILAMQMRDSASEYSHVRWTGAVHSDFFPILEYAAARGFFVGSQAKGVQWLDRRRQSPLNANLWVKQYMTESKPTAADLKNCYKASVSEHGLNDKQAFAWARVWFESYPDDREAKAAFMEQAGANHDSVIKDIGRPCEVKVPFVSQKLWCSFAFSDYAARRTCLRDTGAVELIRDFEAVAQTEEGRKDSDVNRWCGELCYDAGRYGDAAGYLEAAVKILSDSQRARGNEYEETAVLLCHSLMLGGQAARARDMCPALFPRGKVGLRAALVRAEIDAMLAVDRRK